MNRLVTGAFTRSSGCCCSVTLQRTCYRTFTTTRIVHDEPSSSADVAASTGTDAVTSGAGDVITTGTTDVVTSGVAGAATDVLTNINFADLAKTQTTPIRDAVMSGFSWVTDLMPSFSFGSKGILYDTVRPRLLHLYIPSVYEAVQNYTGLSYFVVIGCGTLVLRSILFFLFTRKSIQFPKLMYGILPMHESYTSMIAVLKKMEDITRAKKLQKLQEDLLKNTKPGSIISSFIASGISMVVINSGLRHLATVRPLMDGGIYPFLDMSVLGNSSVGFYALPICVVSALSVNAMFNLRHQKWFNPRISVIAVPIAGVLVFSMSYMPLTMTVHYAVSSWITTLIIASSHNEQARNLLRLPEPYRPEKPVEPIKLGITSPRQHLSPADSRADTTADDFPEAAHSLHPVPVNYQDSQYDQSEKQILQEITATRRRRLYEENLENYTPFFKLGRYAEEEPATPIRGPKMVDNSPPPKGNLSFTDRMVDASEGFNFKFVKRIKAWLYRNKLMRHGKKGKMTEFLEDAPPIHNFIKEPIVLTTEVTPGLKRYVLRRQYPMDTLEQLKRKVSYIERVQNQRW